MLARYFAALATILILTSVGAAQGTKPRPPQQPVSPFIPNPNSGKPCTRGGGCNGGQPTPPNAIDIINGIKTIVDANTVKPKPPQQFPMVNPFTPKPPVQPQVQPQPPNTIVFKPQPPVVYPPNQQVVIPQNIIPQNTIPARPPLVVAPPNVLPQNTVPPPPIVKKNDIDIAPQAPQVAKNVSPEVKFDLTRPQKKKFAGDVDELEDSQLEELSDTLHEQHLVLDKKQSDQIVAMAEKMGHDSTELKAALKSGDPERIEQAMKDTGFNASQVEQVKSKATMGKALEEYTEAIKNGTPQQQAQAEKKLKDTHKEALETAGFGPLSKMKMQNKLNKALDQQEQISMLKEAMKNQGKIDPNNNHPLPPDSVVIVHWPQLRPGEVVVLGPDAVIVGVKEKEMVVDVGRLDELNIPLERGDPVPATDPSAIVSSGVLIRNPERNNASINYTLDGKNYTMKPGEVQTISGKVRIQFDKGGNFGTVVHDLNKGAYEFDLAKDGWGLWLTTYTVVLDNSRNGQDFNYVLNNEAGTVKAKKGQELKSEYPLVLAFDPGTGGEPVYRSLSSGTYRIGISAAGGLDVFPPTEKAVRSARGD